MNLGSNTEARSSETISALTSEYDSLRQKIDLVVATQHKCLFAIMALGSTATGLYYGKSIIADHTVRLHLLLVVSQVVVFITLVVCLMTALLAMLAGHVEAIESRMNERLSYDVFIFESRVVRKFMISPRSLVCWITIALTLFPFAFLVFCICACVDSGRFAFGSIVMAEVVILAVLAVLLPPLRDTVSKFVLDEMAAKAKDSDKE